MRYALHLALLVALLAMPAAAKKKKAIPLIQPTAKSTEVADKAAPKAAAKPADPAENVAFQEIEFGKTLIIEGKVEKPQVQFTLLKEAPPEKEIRFETSFLQNILKQDRENTFKPGERYGRD